MSSERTYLRSDENVETCAVAASATEAQYIDAMSREAVVYAYSDWRTISRAEAMFLDIAFERGKRVLDLGCGAGRFATHLGDRCGSYLGVDASAQMIGAARKTCPDLAFAVADIVEFVADPASYDVVLLMGNVLDCLHPVARRARLLARCGTWLTPGGAIVGSSHLTRPGETRGYYAEDYHGAQVENFRSSLAEIVDEVESHGFEVALAARDYRVRPADWSYWVARLPD
jgi:SAM-dependent methyltransferase